MRNVIALFKSDMRHLCANVMSVIIALGLVLLPSIFTWYNVLACWDVFGNTGNLKVAVASDDEGYKSSLMPLEINVGESVISSLRANNQIDWVFTTSEDAIEGARSGEYYAAVVIPKSFSQDMLSFYDKNAESADIVYYTNEKKNAVSPKITAQGADTISYTVNQVFADTVAKVSVSLAQGLSNTLDQTDAQSMVAALSRNIKLSSDRMNQTADLALLYVDLLNATQGVVDSSIEAAESAANNAEQLSDQAVQGAKDSLSHIEAAKAAYEKSNEEIRAALEALDKMGEVEPNIPSSPLPDDPSLLPSGGISGSGGEALPESVDEIKKNLQQVLDLYENEIRPQLDQLSDELKDLTGQMQDAAVDLKEVGSGLPRIAENLASTLQSAKASLEDSADSLHGVAGNLAELSQTLDSALAARDSSLLKSVLAEDASVLANALSSPVKVVRHAIFPAENFGSAMTPLYATLALFVGALLIMVAIKPQPTSRALKDLGPDANPKPRHLYFGRYGVVGVLSFAQSTVLALGNMLFLGVQVAHPFLLLLCYWVVGQVFAFMMYTFVVSFANLGKAAGVLLLIVQVTACGGSFPLQILPDFVQAISPWVPATHVVNAMRAAMMGVYAGDYWIEMGIILLFVIPLLLLGLVLRKPMARFMHWYVEQVEASGLMS